MKYILIVRHENNRESLLNQALYDSEAEAKKSARWFQKKIEVECEAYDKFWGEKAMRLNSKILVGTANY